MTTEERSNRTLYPLVAYYKAIMKHRAKLSSSKVLAHYGLSPSQYKIMAEMYILWKRMFEVDLTAEKVCYIYKPSSNKREVGYFFLAPWEKKKIVMTNLSYSCERWKEKNV